MDRDDPAYRGQARDTKMALSLCDPIVLGPVAVRATQMPPDRGRLPARPPGSIV